MIGVALILATLVDMNIAFLSDFVVWELPCFSGQANRFSKIFIGVPKGRSRLTPRPLDGGR